MAKGRMARQGDKRSQKPAQPEMPRSLAGIDLFAYVDAASRQTIERRCAWRRWASGEQIIDRENLSNDVYFVVSGRVRVVDYSDTGHREVIFDEIGPGGYFGELAAIDGEPRSANILAEEETVTASLTSDAFVDMLFHYREAGLAFMRRLSEIVRTSTSRIMDLSTLAVQNRIYAELLRQAKTGGGRPPNTAIIHPVPVHSDIAARVSTTRETVARVLSDLAHRGLLHREHDNLVILDLKHLTDLTHKTRD
jgi:CRP/FNR family transcriptional regulator, cyclic AMP receptor protein